MGGIVYDIHTRYVFLYINKSLFSWPGEFKLNQTDSGLSAEDEDRFIGPVELTAWVD